MTSAASMGEVAGGPAVLPSMITVADRRVGPEPSTETGEPAAAPELDPDRPPQLDEEPAAAERRRWWRPVLRLAGPAAEMVVAFGAAGLLVLSVRPVRVNPIDRIGQVSGLAAVQVRYLLIGLVLVAVAALGLRGGPAVRSWVIRLSCAGLAGAVSGFIAGGLMVALTGTPWPLFADLGDAGRLAEWAADLSAGRSVPELDLYPPGFIHTLSWYAELTGQSTNYALKDLEIIGTACLGPVAYLCWRFHLSPGWALGIGVTAMLPVVDAYKPYEPLVMIAFVPLVAAFLGLVQRAERLSLGKLLGSGLATGAAFGVLLLSYTGWFVWSAAGVAVAMVFVINWRRPLWPLVYVAVTAVTFLAVSGWYLVTMLMEAVNTRDRFFAGSTRLDPALLINTSGRDLAGVNLFTVLLVVGLGVAIGLGYRRSFVIAAVACLASAWLMRFKYAADMFDTRAVQLYPRTTLLVLHCLVLLAGFAVFLTAAAVRHRLADLRRWTAGPDRTDIAVDTHAEVDPAERPARWTPGWRPVGMVAALAALVFGFGIAASAVSDGLMPRENSLSWSSHTRRTQEGGCPTFSPQGADCN